MPKKMSTSSEQKNTPRGYGGAREGAGRKKGSGQYGEETKVIRVPVSKASAIKSWLTEQANDLKRQQEDEHIMHRLNEIAEVNRADIQTPLKLPLYSHKVVAGFPSPADDYVETRLDLNSKLIHNKEATFFLTVQGDSMKKVGIKDGDMLIVDKSLTPVDGKIVIAAVDGELTVKRLSIKSTGTWLVPENDDYEPIPIREESDVVIWGVVTATVSLF